VYCAVSRTGRGPVTVIVGCGNFVQLCTICRTKTNREAVSVGFRCNVV